ncbi:MAG: hypothetical protein FWE94_07530 [Coriobacteriia bacterium]|nr:hypothetical protein [Coriobacteriia bacterium]
MKKLKYIGKSDPISLINGKVYDAVGENSWAYLVIDEENEEYAYPKELFEPSI